MSSLVRGRFGLLLIATLILPGSLLPGCAPVGSRVAAPRPVEFADASDMITELTVTPTAFHAGETVRIHVRAFNPTARTAVLHFSSGCFVGFTVSEVAGATVIPQCRACTLDAPTVLLEAGRALEQDFTWNGLDECNRGTALPAGDYRVIGRLNSGPNGVASEAVPVRILAP